MSCIRCDWRPRGALYGSPRGHRSTWTVDPSALRAYKMLAAVRRARHVCGWSSPRNSRDA
eukprot:363628-Chlamydomonas_euryale.AAC.9